MSIERHEQLSAELRPFLDLWRSCEVVCVAIGEEAVKEISGDLMISLATRLVLRPEAVSANKPFNLKPQGLKFRFLATRIEYPLQVATQKIFELVAKGRITLEQTLFPYPVWLTAALEGLDRGELPITKWTPVRIKRGNETAAYGTSRPCIVLEDTLGRWSIARLITDNDLRAIDSYLGQLRPRPINGLLGLVSSLVPGIRFTMDTSPAVQIVAPLPFDLAFIDLCIKNAI